MVEPIARRIDPAPQPEAAPSSPTILKERLARLRELARSKSARETTLVNPCAHPRYDHTYFDGVDWLNELT
jgi:hypothetical protein